MYVLDARLKLKETSEMRKRFYCFDMRKSKTKARIISIKVKGIEQVQRSPILQPHNMKANDTSTLKNSNRMPTEEVDRIYRKCPEEMSWSILEQNCDGGINMDVLKNNEKPLRRLSKEPKTKERRKRTSEMLYEKKKSNSELISEAGTQMQSLAHLVANGTTSNKNCPQWHPEKPQETGLTRQSTVKTTFDRTCSNAIFGRHHQGNGVEMPKFEAYSLAISEPFDHPPPG